jgi:hypothetical protein
LVVDVTSRAAVDHHSYLEGRVCHSEKLQIKSVRSGLQFKGYKRRTNHARNYQYIVETKDQVFVVDTHIQSETSYGKHDDYASTEDSNNAWCPCFVSVLRRWRPRRVTDGAFGRVRTVLALRHEDEPRNPVILICSRWRPKEGRIAHIVELQDELMEGLPG